jgi:ribosomal protein S27AE
MPAFRTKVIRRPRPGTRPILVLHKAPALRGDNGSDRYLCGGCGATLLEEIGEGIDLGEIALKCPVCGAFSELR